MSVTMVTVYKDDARWLSETQLTLHWLKAQKEVDFFLATQITAVFKVGQNLGFLNVNFRNISFKPIFSPKYKNVKMLPVLKTHICSVFSEMFFYLFNDFIGHFIKTLNYYIRCRPIWISLCADIGKQEKAFCWLIACS